MNYLHNEVYLTTDDVVTVSIDDAANVRLFDTVNYTRFRKGSANCDCIGGRAERSPVRLSPSYNGIWHIVVDLGGKSGEVKASIEVVRKGK
ncbi:MAG: DUF1883 domain-containing protein [Spirochaetaceae bacterium]|jgi:hypothetical protein|nr:DUF1883 domain-containing protein [Spirochaetaceae bacterium]